MFEVYLGGGFKHLDYVHSYLGKMNPIWGAYFFRWLETTNKSTFFGVIFHPTETPISLNGHSGGGRENVTPFTPPMFNSPWKMMVWRLLSFWGPAYFQGRTVKLRGRFWRSAKLFGRRWPTEISMIMASQPGPPMVQVPPWQIKP